MTDEKLEVHCPLHVSQSLASDIASHALSVGDVYHSSTLASGQVLGSRAAKLQTTNDNELTEEKQRFI